MAVLCAVLNPRVVHHICGMIMLQHTPIATVARFPMYSATHPGVSDGRT